MKYPDITLGRVEAVWNKLGGEEGVQRFLRGETTVVEPTRSWREQDGVIYFSVTSDGTTGPEWIKRLEKKGFRISSYAKSVLHLKDFRPTKGITTEVAVLKGELFQDTNRVTSKIRAEADKRKFTKLNAEVACLVREKFSDEEIKAMGLVLIIAMHEPVKDSGGNPILLGADRGRGGHWLSACWDGPDRRWGRVSGFAFAVA